MYQACKLQLHHSTQNADSCFCGVALPFVSLFGLGRLARMMICIKSAKDDSNNVNTATLVYFSRNPSLQTQKRGANFKLFSFFFPFFVLHKVEMHLIAGEETFPLFFSLFMCYYPA